MPINCITHSNLNISHIHIIHVIGEYTYQSFKLTPMCRNYFDLTIYQVQICGVTSHTFNQ